MTNSSSHSLERIIISSLIVGVSENSPFVWRRSGCGNSHCRDSGSIFSYCKRYPCCSRFVAAVLPVAHNFNLSPLPAGPPAKQTMTRISHRTITLRFLSSNFFLLFTSTTSCTKRHKTRRPQDTFTSTSYSFHQPFLKNAQILSQ